MIRLVAWLPVLPFFMALATVFAVCPELGNGVVSGKYFRFYLSMGLIALICAFGQFKIQNSRFKIQNSRFKIARVDWAIGLFGLTTLSISCFVHSSEAATKHVLLGLTVLLYFYFRWFLSVAKSHGYWLSLFFLATGLVEAFWGLRQLYGFEYSQHARFRLTGSFFNPGPYACYLSVVLPAAFWYLLRDRGCTKVKFRFRYWPLYLRWGTALLTCVAIVLALPAAMSRTSWLAAAGGCGMIIYSKIQRLRIQDLKFSYSVIQSFSYSIIPSFDYSVIYSSRCSSCCPASGCTG
jgi:hypothetical protein